MKNLKKLILGILCVFAMAAIVKVPAEAATYLTQTNCSQNSAEITINRSAFSGTITPIYYECNNTKTYFTDTNVSSFTISNLPDNFAGDCTMYYKKSGSSTTWYVSGDVNTLPTVPSKDSLGFYGTVYSASSIRFGVTASGSTYSSDRGAYIQLFKNNTLVGTYDAKYGTSVFYTDSLSLAKNTVYKYRVAYYYDNYNGTRYVSPAYSEMRQFVIPSFTYSKSGKGAIKLKLKKVTGVSKYVVQVSTKSDSGFKNAKTVKISKKKKTYTVKVTKKLKKKKTNYIKLRIYISGYGYSDIVGTGSSYIY